MTAEEAIKVFEAGGLVGAKLEAVQEICCPDPRFALVLTQVNGKKVTLQMRHKKQPRIYKTVQAGINEIERIGFQIHSLTVGQKKNG